MLIVASFETNVSLNHRFHYHFVAARCVAAGSLSRAAEGRLRRILGALSELWKPRHALAAARACNLTGGRWAGGRR